VLGTPFGEALSNRLVKDLTDFVNLICVDRQRWPNGQPMWVKPSK
jgi:hypothetical protein